MRQLTPAKLPGKIKKTVHAKNMKPQIALLRREKIEGIIARVGYFCIPNRSGEGSLTVPR